MSDETPIHDAVLAYFDSRQWPITEDREAARIVVPVSGRNGQWLAHASIREDQEQLAIHSVVPAPVPPELREPMALFLTRVNFGLMIGNFELDLDDGEVRFKTSVDLEGTGPLPTLIDQLVQANFVLTDHYLVGIAAVLDGADPAEAAASV